MNYYQRKSPVKNRNLVIRFYHPLEYNENLPHMDEYFLNSLNPRFYHLFGYLWSPPCSLLWDTFRYDVKQILNFEDGIPIVERGLTKDSQIPTLDLGERSLLITSNGSLNLEKTPNKPNPIPTFSLSSHLSS